MNQFGSALLAAATLFVGVASAEGVATAQERPGAQWQGEETHADWIVEEQDNVCGLTDARQIRSPAVVDYEKLLNASPEVKEMKRKGIDRESPEGQVLYNKAVDRVRNAASKVMKDKGYDSIWKKIKHRRGQKATDVTSEVKRIVEKGGKQA